MNMSANPLASAPVVAAPMGVSANALAQREAVRMQAAMLLAITYPRDEAVALNKLLKACARTELAEEAMYEYAKGGTKVTGPTIRLAEEMQRCWGHIMSGVEETRGTTSSEWRSYAWDLETLSGDEKLITVKHWRDTKQGGYAVTDERDIYEIGANMAARRKRACILACIPQYVQDAAEAACRKTLVDKVDITPERINIMLESFAAYNVTADMIEKRIQRRLDAITAPAMVLLRNIYNSLRDGMGKVSDFFEVPEAAPAGSDPNKPGQTRTEAAKEALRKRGGAKASKDTAAPEAAEGRQQSAIPFYDQASALEYIRGAPSPVGLTACWLLVFKDYTDSGRQLPNAIPIEALRKCTTGEDLAALWKVITVSYRGADLEMPIEVEAVYHEQSEVLEQKQ